MNFEYKCEEFIFGIVFKYFYFKYFYFEHDIFYTSASIMSDLCRSQAFLRRIISPGFSPAIKSLHDGFHKAVVNPAKTV